MRTHWSKRKDTPEHLIKLNSNETVDTALDVHLEKFISSLSPTTITRYPDIKQAYINLAKLIQVPDDQIYITAGADQAIRSIIHTLNIKSMNIHLPTFELCRVYCELYGIDITPCGYKRVDDEFVRTPVNNSGSIYVVAPDSVTGASVTKDHVSELCAKHEHVILDETYSTHDNRWLRGMIEHDNLYVVRSFSKTGGAAGLRVGYVISNKENINQLYQWRPMFEINSIGAEYIKYITNNEHVMKLSVDSVKLGKKLLEDHLKVKGYRVYKTHANYTLVLYDENLDKTLSKVCEYKLVIINQTPYIRITSASPDVIRKLTREIQ